MIRDFLRTTLKEDASLFRAIHRFNCRMATYLNEQRMETVAPKELFQKLALSPRGERRLSRRIGNVWDLDREGYWDFRDPLSRIALLEHSALKHLALLTGTTAFREQLSRVIDRATINKIKEAVDSESYQFAVKRSSFLVKKRPEWLRQDQPLARDEIENLAAKIETVGWECLALSFSHQPRALVQRLELKFPKDISIQAIQSNRQQSEEAADMVLRIFQCVSSESPVKQSMFVEQESSA